MRQIPYVIIINALAYLLMLIDKQNAKKHRRRIPEIVLLGIAAIGGSLGTLAAMDTLRHKTRHSRFTVGVPIMLVIHLLIIFADFFLI